MKTPTRKTLTFEQSDRLITRAMLMHLPQLQAFAAGLKIDAGGIERDLRSRCIKRVRALRRG